MKGVRGIETCCRRSRRVGRPSARRGDRPVPAVPARERLRRADRGRRRPSTPTAQAMAATDLIVQCVTMSTIERDQVAGLRAAVEAGTGFTGWHGGIADSYRALSRLPAAGRRSVRDPPRQAPGRTRRRTERQLPRRTRCEFTPLGRDAPDHRGPGRLRADHRAVLGAARRPQRRAGHHDASGSAVASVAPADHLAGRSGRAAGARGASSSRRPVTASTCSSTRPSAPSSKGECCGQRAAHRNHRRGSDLGDHTSRPSPRDPTSRWRRSPTSTWLARDRGGRHPRSPRSRGARAARRPRHRRRAESHDPGRARRDRARGHRERQARVRREAARGRSGRAGGR